MSLNYEESVETLKGMFETLDEDTIITVLAANRIEKNINIKVLSKLF